MDLTPETETRARFDTLSKRERVFDLQGKRLEQRQDLAELTQLASQLDDAPVLRAQIAIRQAKLEIDVGDFAAAMSSARAAIQEIEGDAHTHGHAPELLVDALLMEAQAMFFAGQAAATKSQLEDALTLAREHHYVRGEYNALAQLGLWGWHTGDYNAAADMMEQSLLLIQQASDVRREIEILNNLGIIAKAKSRFSANGRTGNTAHRAANHLSCGQAGIAAGYFAWINRLADLPQGAFGVRRCLGCMRKLALYPPDSQDHGAPADIGTRPQRRASR